MKILITGAAGLIGKEVTKGLVAAGHEVLATDLVKDDLSPAQKFVVGDLVSADFISQLDFHCDAIVHLGSIPRPGIDSDEKVLHNNVMGTYHMFANAVENKVPLVIYASSLSIYGFAWSGPWTSPDYVPVDEKHPLHHYESYALSKEVNERSADMWAHRSETAFVGLRFPHTHTHSVFAEMAQQMRDGDKAILQQGAKIFWAYLDLRDAVQGILTVIEKGAKGSKTYNFAAPDTYAHKPTSEMMAEFHPTSEVVSPLSGYDSIIDCSEWLSEYGYQPQYLLKREDTKNT
jgi:nucleoside-diphosphate-sugar epimerase